MLLDASKFRRYSMSPDTFRTTLEEMEPVETLRQELALFGP
jgi:hypothetical protein